MHLVSVKKRRRRRSNCNFLDEEGVFAGKLPRVIVADSNEVFRHRLRNTLIDVDGFKVAAEASHSSNMLKQGAMISIDLMLMDVSLRGGDVVEAMQHMIMLALPP